MPPATLADAWFLAAFRPDPRRVWPVRAWAVRHHWRRAVTASAGGTPAPSC